MKSGIAFRDEAADDASRVFTSSRPWLSQGGGVHPCSNAHATFMLTFDCEGKWGMVDCLAPRHQSLFVTPHLEATYRRLVNLLQRYRLHATFAFTTAFTLSHKRFKDMQAQVELQSRGAEPWMQRALAHIASDHGEGWFAPGCFRIVCEAGPHEIASHGFSHLPWGTPFSARSALAAELALTRAIPEFSADRVKTFVFPRNQITHKDLLPAHGFMAFREASRLSNRAVNLIREFDVFAGSEAPCARSHQLPIGIPSGRFINWRHGLRRAVPPEVTVRRWKHIIRHAIRTGGVVHAWTHPENFLDGHSMFPMMEQILREVAEQRDAGRMQVLTNMGYVKSMDFASNGERHA